MLPSELTKLSVLDWNINMLVVKAGADADREEMDRARAKYARGGDGEVRAVSGETPLSRALKRKAKKGQG